MRIIIEDAVRFTHAAGGTYTYGGLMFRFAVHALAIGLLAFPSIVQSYYERFSLFEREMVATRRQATAAANMIQQHVDPQKPLGSEPAARPMRLKLTAATDMTSKQDPPAVPVAPVVAHSPATAHAAQRSNDGEAQPESHFRSAAAASSERQPPGALSSSRGGTRHAVSFSMTSDTPTPRPMEFDISDDGGEAVEFDLSDNDAEDDVPFATMAVPPITTTHTVEAPVKTARSTRSEVPKPPRKKHRKEEKKRRTVQSEDDDSDEQVLLKPNRDADRPPAQVAYQRRNRTRSHRHGFFGLVHLPLLPGYPAANRHL
jgi:hypothetical protein